MTPMDLWWIIPLYVFIGCALGLLVVRDDVKTNYRHHGTTSVDLDEAWTAMLIGQGWALYLVAALVIGPPMLLFWGLKSGINPLLRRAITPVEVRKAVK